MTEHEHNDAPLLPAEPEYVPGGSRRRKRKRLPGCLAVLVALALVVGGVWLAGSKVTDFLSDKFASAPDYDGPGRGKIVFEVASGDSAAAICRGLKDDDVVASVDSCISAAQANGDSAGIQVGFYELKKEMASADAIDVLVDPANLQTSSVTVPEGLNVDQVVEVLAKGTEFGASRFRNVLDQPAKLGLPDYAEGNPEGYLFPSTYAFGPKDKPADMLSAMVDRWEQAAEDADLEGAAEELGYTPHELMTIASLVEAEGRGDDMPKVARVVYNRLELEPNPTAGFLQIDATVNYALDKSPIARLTLDEIDSVADSPYNTYKQKGLPPGPIEAPGDAAIAAAAAPAEGPWFFYVTVNLETGETKFTDSYDEFLGFRSELDEYCDTQSDRC
ncbi:putative aminodeoxychorismate lyase [Nocardioides dokdonensis FR1436]|uniref:Endolytic murein transglycosylase n=1 Tax=Nocardioides dokdonensis FR1436 TaxID=1300347 RepID=A0A1A9GPJ4_9ACTN|nr:endolytic transglycosylase MltG [Nocardioides dokdonensis]ANH39401.1 putative aminodeoxychorismate lyase [Nocardioides dokdonensis FR1436]